MALSHLLDTTPPSLLTTAARGGLRPAPDCRPRRALLHLSYSSAPLHADGAFVTHDPSRTSAVSYCWQKSELALDRAVRGRPIRAAYRVRNAAAYAVSEIPRLRAAPIMPASAIIVSTPTTPRNAKAIAPPATPPLPPRKVQALTMPEP